MKETNTYKFILLVVCLILMITTPARAQNGISKIWMGVDSVLRANVPDASIKAAIQDAKLKTVVPNSAGILMIYNMKDGNEAHVNVRMTTKGEILSAKM